MKKKGLCILISVTMYMQCDQQKTADPTVINLIVENKQEANSNSVVILQPQKKMRCSDCKNVAELKGCLQAATKKKRRALLQKLPAQVRNAYIKNLTRDEYEEFLSLFTEQTWRDFLAHLSQSEQQRWPQSVKEQLDKLQLIKKNGDAYYYKRIIRDVILDLAFLPIPLAYPVIVSLDSLKHAENALENEKKEYTDYLKEKFS